MHSRPRVDDRRKPSWENGEKWNLREGEFYALEQPPFVESDASGRGGRIQDHRMAESAGAR